MRELVIDRNTWWRGNGTVGSKLLREQDNKMCCLGHYSLACGLKPENIREFGNPGQLKTPLPMEMSWLLDEGDADFHASRDCYELMGINDIVDIPNRETEIAELFAKQGVTVTFTN